MSATEARVVFDSPASGPYNMAVDQALLMSAEQDGIVTLRLYGWAEPTLSLGYFQKYTDRQLHSASLKCPVVRRRSGGGAILHDHELTYSLSIPSSNRWSDQNAELYDLVHRVVIQLLARDGIESQLYKEVAPESESSIANPAAIIDPNAFLCFQRRSDGDLVTGGFKVLGSAQRRLKHSLLQHGSLLFGQSKFASELPGLFELAGKQIKMDGFSTRFCEMLGEALGFDFTPAGLTASEIALAAELEAGTFGAKDWTQKR